MRRYKYQNSNIATMILTPNQIKQEKCYEINIWKKIDIIYALMKLFLEEEKCESENRLQKVKICYIWDETQV